MSPTPGKISYVQIPAADVDRSADFYETVFGWNIRRRDGGQIAFDDAAGEVSGTWLTDRPPTLQPGLLIYIDVDERRPASPGEDRGGRRGDRHPLLRRRAKGRRLQPSAPAGNVLGVLHERAQ